MPYHIGETIAYLVYWGDEPGQCRKVHSSTGVKEALNLFRGIEHNFPVPGSPVKITRVDRWTTVSDWRLSNGWRTIYRRRGM